MALRILLADDSMTAQNMGKKILTDAGFDVVTVSNGAAAAKKLAEGAPDIAILDVYMPGYTGLELCERLKSAPITANVPVLLSVGKMEPFRPEDGMKVRADGVIIKPFEATDLVMVIDKLAERTYGAETKAAVAEPEEQEEEAAEPFDEPPLVREAAAEGLETFAPVSIAAPAVAPEPHLEFTSAPKVGDVAAAQAEDLMPTLVQPHEVEEAPLPEIAAPIFEPVQAVAAEELPEAVEEPTVAALEETPVAVDETPTALEETPEAEAVGYSLEEEPVVEIIEDDEIDADAAGELPTFDSPALAEEAAHLEEIAADTQVSSFETASDETALTAEATELEGTANIEVAPDPALLPREEEASLVPAVEIAPEMQETQSTDWTAIESEVAENIDLDLEAEMHDGVTVSEPAVSEPIAPMAMPAPVQQAAPFLAPLGKTSFDELDAVMEEHAAKSEPVLPVVAEEISLGAPIADPAEQEPVLAPNDDIAVSLNQDEMLAGIEAAKAQAVVAPQQPVQRVEDAPVLEEAQRSDSEELLETGEAAKDPLAFYGISEDEAGDILHNPVDELDEPLFSVAGDLAPIPQGEASEEQLLDEVPADILESDTPEPVAASQAVESAELEQVEEPLLEAEESPAPEALEAEPAQEDAELTVVDEPVDVVPDEQFESALVEEVSAEEVAAEADVPAVEEAAAEPAPEAIETAPEPAEPAVAEEDQTPVVEEPVEEPAATEPSPVVSAETVPTESTAAGIAEALPVAAVAAAAAAEVKSVTEHAMKSGENVPLDEVVAAGMVGRVVDRVVDRLKPILTVMVEELLKEVKK